MITDLMTKGYCVIPNLVDSTVIAELLEKYTEGEQYVKQFTSSYSAFSTTAMDVSEKIFPIIDLITNLTSIKVDVCSKHIVYFDNQLSVFGWHQDHESYYCTQDSFNALTCWIPIQKPETDLSGLGFIPQDAFRKECPEIYDKYVLGKGAKRIGLYEDANSWYMMDDEDGVIIKLPESVVQLAEYPKINVGDALIFRQDVFHKTQDATSNRIAISTKIFNSNAVINKEKFFSGCEIKRTRIKNASSGFKPILDYFENSSKEFGLFKEIYKGYYVSTYFK